jgi:hypothetical protein
MPETCEQCMALETQISEIKDAIAEEIRRGHRHRSEPADKNRPSLARLLSILTETEDFYRDHKKVFHENQG